MRRLEKLLRKGEVRLDGKRAKSADRVIAGQTLRLPPQVIHDKSRAARQKAAAGADLAQAGGLCPLHGQAAVRPQQAVRAWRPRAAPA